MLDVSIEHIQSHVIINDVIDDAIEFVPYTRSELSQNKIHRVIVIRGNQ